MHTVKPLDVKAVIEAARETKAVLTCEEHQTGGFGNIIAGAISLSDLKKPIIMDMIGVDDRFGESGQPWELMKVFGLTAESIAQKAHKLVTQKD